MPHTLAHHLAQGYDAYQHNRKGPWTREAFGEELKAIPDLLKAARAKLADLEAVKRAKRGCHISDVQYRILSDAIAAVDAKA